MTNTITGTPDRLQAYWNEIMNTSCTLCWEVNVRAHYTHTHTHKLASANEWMNKCTQTSSNADLSTQKDSHTHTGFVLSRILGSGHTEQNHAHFFPELLATLLKLNLRIWSVWESFRQKDRHSRLRKFQQFFIVWHLYRHKNNLPESFL